MILKSHNWQVTNGISMSFHFSFDFLFNDLHAFFWQRTEGFCPIASRWLDFVLVAAERWGGGGTMCCIIDTRFIDHGNFAHKVHEAVFE